MQPPKEFVDKLQRFDPELRLRWAKRTSMWIIERKLPLRHRQLTQERPSPYKSLKGMDLWDGWREGYVHILTVHPELLDERVFEHLREADTWRAGGMEKFSERLDKLQEIQEAQEDRDFQTWNQAAAREAHDRFQWLEGNRISMHQPVEREGFKVTDRRFSTAKSD